MLLIERVYRFAVALRTMGIDPEEVRPALIVSMPEAFCLLDQLASGPWQLAVWAPKPAGYLGEEEVERMAFDLRVQPRPGVWWASLFGVALIVEGDVVPRDI